jgi:hypothetical protein
LSIFAFVYGFSVYSKAMLALQKSIGEAHNLERNMIGEPPRFHSNGFFPS